MSAKELYVGGKPLSSLRVVDLKDELEKRGLSKSGSKKDLLERLKLNLQIEKQREEQQAIVVDDDQLPNQSMQETFAEQNPFLRDYFTSQAELFHSQKGLKKLYEEKKLESEQSSASADEGGEIGSPVKEKKQPGKVKKLVEQFESTPTQTPTPTATRSTRSRRNLQQEVPPTIVEEEPAIKEPEKVLEKPPPPLMAKDTEPEIKSPTLPTQQTTGESVIKKVTPPPPPLKKKPIRPPSPIETKIEESVVVVAEEIPKTRMTRRNSQKEVTTPTKVVVVEDQPPPPPPTQEIKKAKEVKEEDKKVESPVLPRLPPPSSSEDETKVRNLTPPSPIKKKLIRPPSPEMLTKEKDMEPSPKKEKSPQPPPRTITTILPPPSAAEDKNERKMRKFTTSPVTIQPPQPMKRKLILRPPSPEIQTEVLDYEDASEDSVAKLNEKPKTRRNSQKEVEAAAAVTKIEEKEKLPTILLKEPEKVVESIKSPVKFPTEDKKEPEPEVKVPTLPTTEESVIKKETPPPPPPKKKLIRPPSPDMQTEVLDYDDASEDSVAKLKEKPKTRRRSSQKEEKEAVAAIKIEEKPPTILLKEPEKAFERVKSPVKFPTEDDKEEAGEKSPTPPPPGEEKEIKFRKIIPPPSMMRKKVVKPPSPEAMEIDTEELDYGEAEETAKLKYTWTKRNLILKSRADQKDVVQTWQFNFAKNYLSPQKAKIDTNLLATFYPDVKFLPISEFDIEKSFDNESSIETETNEKELQRQERFKEEPKIEQVVKREFFEPPEANGIQIGTSSSGGKRKISIVPLDENEEEKELTPPRNKPSNLLVITNLVRPFTLTQLKELLQRTGNIEDIWVDRIKSKCIAKFSKEEEAFETRAALHGIKWPLSNIKSLYVDYSTEEALAESKIETNAALEKAQESKPQMASDRQVREWDVGKKRSRSRSRSPRSRIKRLKRSPSPSGTNPEKTNSQLSKSTERHEPLGKALDELFRKTVATPCIYWLPLTPEQISEKEEMRRKRLEERERRLKALEEMALQSHLAIPQQNYRDRERGDNRMRDNRERESYRDNRGFRGRGRFRGGGGGRSPLLPRRSPPRVK